jgi:hypothetical protein
MADARIIALNDRIRRSLVEGDIIDDLREAVALRLAPVLAEAGAAAADVLALPDDAWTLAVDIARDRDPQWHPRPAYSPSDNTRRRVARLLALREASPDPFAGFPQ